MSRVYNFSAGPAVLPLEVLQAAQNDLVDYKGSGMSVMEMSHRGKDYDAIHQEAIATFTELCGLGDDWSVCFIQGGASMQFAMIPMNFLGKDAVADYVKSGAWDGKAIKEASPFDLTFIITCAGQENYVASSESFDYDCYESQCCYFEQGTAEKLVGIYLDPLNELKAS